MLTAGFSGEIDSLSSFFPFSQVFGSILSLVFVFVSRLFTDLSY